MPLRVLVIDANADYRRLFGHHIGSEWQDALIVEHDPVSQGGLPREFTAAGFDVVILDSAAGSDGRLEWLRDFKRRPGFPPVIFVAADGDEMLAARAIKSGAAEYFPKHRIRHQEFVQAVREAARERKQQLARQVRTGARDKASQFGSVKIRGMRCVRQLALGGVSSVYLAESEKLGKLLVLKVLRQVPDVAEGKNTFDRFIREYELIARIDHPNVVRIYDLGVADDHAYIAMEYFPDGDLRTRLRGPMPSETALVYLAQIAEALAAIHAVGVLHRDLKPGNVMLREDGSVALIDFGLARELRMEAEITETGEIFGTPYYMSPEQGHADHLDERADLYSLGVIFYEMLTGKKPYMGSTPMAVIYMHSHAPLPRFDPGLAHLQPLLDRMMAKEPGERFQSAEELLDVLALLVPEQTVQQARSLT